MKIEKIESSRSPVFQYLFDSTWQRDIDIFENETGIQLPQLSIMGKIKKETLWRAFYKKMEIKAIWENGDIWAFSFGVGFMTDLGSVPQRARSFIDNDDKRMIPAYLCHDFFFQSKVLGYDDSGMCEANRFLIEASRCCGATMDEIAYLRIATNSKQMKEAYYAREKRDTIVRATFEIIY